ncbi:MAG: DUF5694 domain-containing protein [Pseudomonadota bacterium]
MRSKLWMSWIAGALLSGAVLAAEPEAPEAPAAAAAAPAEVMLIGLFHFANPGLDAVKSEVIDVKTPESQAYLEALTDRIAALEPTTVLLEYNPASQDEIQGEYARYLADDFELPHNEIYQLGFRIARKSDLGEVASCDERNVHWQAGPLMEKLETLPARSQRVQALIKSIGEETTALHRSLPLAELLPIYNDPETDRVNKGFYLMTNDVGAGDGFEGADATASWWHRNFRMYANIQRHAVPGARVVVIAGQGHTAILRDLLADDPDRVALDVRPLF